MARKSQTKIDRDVALATLRETADDGELIGRDPRKVSPEEWARAGISGRAILGAIRAKRLDCCVFQIDEVRKCTAVGCALWPYRMGSNPFRKPVELSDEERARMAERARKHLPRKPRQTSN